MKKFIAIASIVGVLYCAVQLRPPSTKAGIYKVEFDGKAGTKVFGFYVYFDPEGILPQRIEKLEAILPHSITLTPKPGYSVMAGAIPYSRDRDAVATIITKDGTDCTQPVRIGTGTLDLFSCSTDNPIP